jgi:hypothetical protein
MDTDFSISGFQRFSFFLNLASAPFPAHTRFMAKKIRCHTKRCDSPLRESETLLRSLYLPPLRLRHAGALTPAEIKIVEDK